MLRSVQQAVDINPQFPSAFTLEVNVPPPPEAMYLNDVGVHTAAGKLVVYRDGNGNGKLDPSTDSLASPDQVLSTELGHYGLQSTDPRTTSRPWAYEVWYLDRPHKFSEQLDLKSGYNVLSYKEYGAKSATEIDLELWPTPALQAQLCNDECIMLDTTPFECPENPSTDLPPRPATAARGYLQNGTGWIWEDRPNSFVFENKHCIQGNGKYEFSWTRTYAGGCSRRRVEACHHGPATQPSPSWPCETYVDL